MSLYSIMLRLHAEPVEWHDSSSHKLPISTLTPCVFVTSYSLSPLYLSVQRGESALQIAVRKGHLDVVKVLVQVYRDLHMENEVDQYYMDLADDHHHEHLVEYLSSEFPTLKRKVSHHCTLHTHIHRCLSSCWDTPSAVCHIACLCADTLCLYRHIHTVMCSFMHAGTSATADFVSQCVVYI